MTRKTVIGLKGLFILVFLLYIFFSFYSFVKPMLIYHVQQPPFLKNGLFFSGYIDYPGGLAEYMGNFIAQSFYSSFWGSLVIVSLCLLLLLLLLQISSTIVHDGYFVMFIPVLVLFFLFHDYHFPLGIVVKLLLATLTIAGVIMLGEKPKLVAALFPLSALVLYYLAGSASLMVYLLSVSIWFLFKQGNRNRFLIPVIALAGGMAIPFIAYHFCWNISRDKLWFSFDSPVGITGVTNPGYYLLYFSVPFIMLLLSVAGKLSRFGKTASGQSGSKAGVTMVKGGQKVARNKLALTLVGGFALMASLFMISANAFDRHQQNIVLTGYYAENKDWQKVIDIALSDPVYEIPVNYCFNRAITATGKFAELFFNYPQVLGSDVFYPDKVIAIQNALPASDLYYDAGYISEALHWAYEAHSSMPCNTRIIRRLVMLNLIEGRYQAASVLLDVLKSSFHQEAFVNKYLPFTLDTSLVANDPEIRQKRLYMPLDEVTLNDPASRFQLLYATSKENKMALDFLAMTFLLEHKLAGFAGLYPDLKKVYNDKLPLTYETAMILYASKAGKPNGGYHFNEESIRVINTFNQTMKDFNRDKAAARFTLKNSSGNTYLYYLTYLSPLANKSGNPTK